MQKAKLLIGGVHQQIKKAKQKHFNMVVNNAILILTACSFASELRFRNTKSMLTIVIHKNDHEFP
jgi:hypothetical protein